MRHSIEEMSGRAVTSESAFTVDDAVAVAGVESVSQAGQIPADSESPPHDLWFRRRIKLRNALRDVWRYRELIRSLAERDYRSRYKQALLGITWSVLTPVLMMVVFTVVFTRFQHINTGGAPYVLFSYLGVLPWTFFSNSISGGGQSIVSNMALVNKVSCPREVFPLGTIVVAAIDTLIASVVLLFLFAVTGVAPKPQTLYAPVLLLVLLVFTVGLTLLVSSVLVYLRDLRLVLPLLLQLGLFLTPVAYGMNVLIHTRWKLVLYSFLNPVAPVIDGLRRTVLDGLAPDWELLGAGAAGALLAFVVGYIVFKRLEVGIADIA